MQHFANNIRDRRYLNLFIIFFAKHMKLKLNFEGLQMRTEVLPKVKRKRLNYLVKESTEPKEIERALKIPAKEFLKKNIVELRTYKGNRVIGLFTVPKNYSSEDEMDYEYFLETSLDAVRYNEGYKLVKEIESELERKVFTITSARVSQVSASEKRPCEREKPVILDDESDDTTSR